MTKKYSRIYEKDYDKTFISCNAGTVPGYNVGGSGINGEFNIMIGKLTFGHIFSYFHNYVLKEVDIHSKVPVDVTNYLGNHKKAFGGIDNEYPIPFDEKTTSEYVWSIKKIIVQHGAVFSCISLMIIIGHH